MSSLAINQIENILSLFVPDKEKRGTIISLINGFIQTSSSGLYIKPSTAATMLECEERSIQNLIKSGKLRAKRMENGHVRIYRSSLEKYMDSLPEAYTTEESEIKRQVDNLQASGYLWRK